MNKFNYQHKEINYGTRYLKIKQIKILTFNLKQKKKPEYLKIRG